ncbi:MAG: beta-ketoacyl synthase chain length factor [Bacteroidetes bacterium]|nr:beta-ketoacyl synthase chain length factor [Bacteroidota bacterium]MBK8329809.1 beta-ketoacyl synthase chain length factor [Bacteroidota bacterium]
MKPIYIISSACISPQHTFEAIDFLSDASIVNARNNVLYCIEPDFKQFINPVQIRRMSRALKIGFSAAMKCINESEIKEIDAIIIGTGKGCLEDTEAFLHSIKQYHESALNPTHFIHSTYNQLNGMIALNKKINSYNVTYAHRGFSFEHTLVDASLLLAEGEANHVLAGSFDEMTLEHFTVKKVWGYWKVEPIESKDLLLSKTPGTIAGEGSAFFILGNQKTKQNQAFIKSIRTMYKPTAEEIAFQIDSILQENDLLSSDIDVLMLGNNGNSNQQHHDLLFADKFLNANFLYFKHLCGEFDTASQFGFWLSTQILEKQQIPKALYGPNNQHKEEKKEIKQVLFYNNYFELNQSLILLSV